jgi:osmoprotectant transport system ATP-binding protein
MRGEDPMIRLTGVGKTYPDGTVAVHELDLDVPRGRTVCLVGPSGCGKSTTLKMVNRLIEPTTGTITLDGDDVTRTDPVELRRRIGYVIQQVGLFPHQTIRANVATVPSLLGWDKKKSRARAEELLALVGLDPKEHADRYPHQLSGGQQQRVGVARALAADPPVMLMDEPFSAVDPVVREGLHREFLRLQQDLGKTIAMVTHDIDEAIKLGDVVAIFRQGGILAQVGTPQELLESPADEFVAEFVGRDRGVRSLSFGSAADVPVKPLTDDLVLDEAGRPVNWRSGGDIKDTFTVKDSLRLVTDLAISSPVGIAVRVDENGKADGLVPHHDLVDHLASRRRK